MKGGEVLKTECVFTNIGNDLKMCCSCSHGSHRLKVYPFIKGPSSSWAHSSSFDTRHFFIETPALSSISLQQTTEKCFRLEIYSAVAPHKWQSGWWASRDGHEICMWTMSAEWECKLLRSLLNFCYCKSIMVSSELSGFVIRGSRIKHP